MCMTSFLVYNKKPVCQWGSLPDETYFKGKVPEGYKLAVSPHYPYIVLDVDVSENKNGFDHIPTNILEELDETFNYVTPRGGRHYWLKYTGDYQLKNTTTSKGIDIRTNRGYAVWYSNENVKDSIVKMNNTSLELNNWIINLFNKNA